MAEFNEKGEQIPDPTPVEIPPHMLRALSNHELMKQYIQHEMSKFAAEQEAETFEEADDFDVDEDPDPLSEYEIDEAAPEWPLGEKDADAAPPPDPAGKTVPRGSKRAGKASLDDDVEGVLVGEPEGRVDNGESEVENAVNRVAGKGKKVGKP